MGWERTWVPMLKLHIKITAIYSFVCLYIINLIWVLENGTLNIAAYEKQKAVKNIKKGVQGTQAEWEATFSSWDSIPRARYLR